MTHFMIWVTEKLKGLSQNNGPGALNWSVCHGRGCKTEASVLDSRVPIPDSRVPTPRLLDSRRTLAHCQLISSEIESMQFSCHDRGVDRRQQLIWQRSPAIDWRSYYTRTMSRRSGRGSAIALLAFSESGPHPKPHPHPDFESNLAGHNDFAEFQMDWTTVAVQRRDRC